MDWLTDLLADPAITREVPAALGETLLMTGLSFLGTVVIGLPLGVLLHAVAPGGLLPVRWLSLVLGAIVNVTRSLPFIILIVVLIPFTRLVAGSTLGAGPASVPLMIAAIPFFARLVESALREVSEGKVEAALVFGANRRDVVLKTLLPESLPTLVAAATTTLITLIGYSTVAGTVGGGGLGFLAVNYGYYRSYYPVLVVTLIVLLIIVQLVQVAGDLTSRALDHRPRSRSRRARRSSARPSTTQHRRGASPDAPSREEPHV